MPPAHPRKIANKIVGGPQRYRPGKPTAIERPSSDEEESDEEQEAAPAPKPAPRPATSSFPKAAFKPAAPTINEDDFETEESEDEDDDGGGVAVGSDDSGSASEDEDDESEEEDDSSSDDDVAKRRLLMRPMFVKKDKRNEVTGMNGASTTTQEPDGDRGHTDEQARRKQRADELVQAQIDKAAEERASAKKFWDDEDVELIDDIDDTDDLDPEAEYAAWKLREMKRLKRDREALIASEKEREEVERRRNLSEAERKAEDDEWLGKQKEEKDSKGKMDYLQKYYHKGAFFQDDEKAREMGLADRDIMGGQFENQVDRSVLPEYLQVRDMTRVGRKGRTKYKDMRTEDTGRWGDFNDRKGGAHRGQDERFMSDRDRERQAERTGANDIALGERKRHGSEDGRESKRPRAAS